MSAEPLNRLEQLLRQAVRNPADRQAFQRELLQGRLYVVCELDDRRQVVQLLPAMLGGELVMPAYTAAQRIQQATDNSQPFVELTTLDILRNRPPNSKLVINPGVWDGCEFRPDEIEAMLAEADPSPALVMPSGSEVRLGQPAERPEWLIATLSKQLAQLRSVRAAHVAMIEIPATGEPPHPVVGLRVADGTEIEGLIQPLKAAVDAASRGRVDFVPIGDDVISVWLLDNTEPFFRR